MKTLLTAIVAAILFSSCASRPPVYRHVEIYGVDYSRYANEGFYFSPYAYTKEYVPVGQYYLALVPGAKYLDECPSGKSECMAWETVGWVVDYAHVQHAVDSMYNLARAAGADALVDVKLSKVTVMPPDRPGLILPIFEVSGFAIKRKGN